MKNRHISRELFGRTRDQPHFTVNDLRKNKFEDLFSHPNQIGKFFGDLARENPAIKTGVDRALHKEAKRRWVWRWVWTEKAVAMFG